MKRSSYITIPFAGLIAASLGAQHASTFDRAKVPPAPTPTFTLPRWTVDTLANGARLVVVEKHDLPIVNLSIHFAGGTNQLGTHRGVSGFVGAMMREGTEKRTADQLNNDLALLGTNVSFAIGTENGSAGFSSLSRSFGAALDLMMDMMLHSTFPAASLERLRTQSLAAYTRNQDVVGTISAQITPKLLYGDQPYGQVVNDNDLKAVTRDDVAGLARQYFVPGDAIVYVVGDMTRAQARAALDRGFASWPAGGKRLVPNYPAAPAPGPTTVYMVDMPNKPQSQIVLAHTVPPQNTPERPAIDVMNAIMGGLFNSRLNHDIREVHGFSYGFNSGVVWQAGSGFERAQGGVTREKTDSSLMLAMLDVRGLAGGVPPTEDEMVAAKSSLVQSMPGRLQSIAGISGVVARIVDDDLPRDWWATYLSAVSSTTPADVTAMTRKYMDPDHLVIVVVGDGAKVLDAVKATGVGPVVQLDKTGKPLPPH